LKLPPSRPTCVDVKSGKFIKVTATATADGPHQLLHSRHGYIEHKTFDSQYKLRRVSIRIHRRYKVTFVRQWRQPRDGHYILHPHPRVVLTRTRTNTGTDTTSIVYANARD
jgi:hypothetical protein